jgi:hypothetical protein
MLLEAPSILYTILESYLVCFRFFMDSLIVTHAVILSNDKSLPSKTKLRDSVPTNAKLPR